MLVSQSIVEMENMEPCKRMEKLFLIENKIQAIKGVDHMTNLTQLHLYSNCITRIENLGTLVQLQVSMHGLRGLHRLRGLGATFRLTDGIAWLLLGHATK